MIKRAKLFPCVLLLALLLNVPLVAQDVPQVFRGALIYPIVGEPIENGVLVVQGGKIVAVGKADEVQVPAGAVEHNVEGKVILPGLVDTHSHIGRGDGGDASGTLHPSVRILDAIDPRATNFKKALVGGITTVNVLPGSGHLMSGQTVYLKLRKNANKIEDMLFVKDATNDIAGGLKMANGTNPLRPAPFTGTRGKSAAVVRMIYLKAQDYREKIKAAGGDRDKLPKRDLDMECLVQVLEGKRIVHHHTHRHDDILTVLRLAKEFGFRVVLHHVSEAWKVAKEIAEAKVPCSIIVLDSPGGKLEAVDIRFENGRVLEEAGVDVAFHTDDSITDSRFFLRSAGLAVRAGMSRKKALEALTLAGARMLDLQDRIGSLEKGKDADFIILSGDPFSVYTHVLQTWVEGQKVYDRSNPDDYKYAVGGYGIYRSADALDDNGQSEMGGEK